MILCISQVFDVAPHNTSRVDPNKHFLRQDLIFGDVEPRKALKWTTTLQDKNSNMGAHSSRAFYSSRHF